MALRDMFSRKVEKRLEPGTYKFDGLGQLKGHRFHLRVDNKDRGVLIMDAAKLIFLNGTALDFVRCILEDRTREETYRFMRDHYRGLRDDVAYERYDMILGQILDILSEGVGVVENVCADSMTIGSDHLPAPYRMDLALTYRCQNDCHHCYNEEKGKKELGVKAWTSIIDKLWKVAIPHIVFTGGEPTLYTGLKELIMKSEENGQITGINSNGRKFGTRGYLKGLVDAGLDHSQITLISHKETLHDRLACSSGAWKETVKGLKVALDQDLYINTNTTIMRSTVDHIEDTMMFLIDLGVRNIAFNSIIRSGKGKETEALTFEELGRVLERLKSIANGSGVNLIWYSPTPYCEFNPVNEGLGIKQCTACSINMAIEPDGTVLPCQSYYKPLGNIQKDPWTRIWDNELCKNIRTRRYVLDKCNDCELLPVCGGGCPLSLQHGDYMCMDRSSSM